jgi:hypothetical protein
MNGLTVSCMGCIIGRAITGQQDLGLTADIMIKLIDRLELDWQMVEADGEECTWIAQLRDFYLAGYARALRGEDITNIELGGV